MSLDKKNGKVCVKGKRLFDVSGSVWLSNSFKKGPCPQEPTWAHGCIDMRSTDGAVLVTLACAWRLADIRADSVLSLYDAATAFGPVSWPNMLEAYEQLSPPEDLGPHEEALAQQAFDYEAPDGVGTYRPSEGILMGRRSVGPRGYTRCYNEKLKS